MKAYFGSYRSRTPREPHQFDAALDLMLIPAAELNPFEVAVDLDLQQHRWVIGRTTNWGRIDPLNSRCAQVEFIDENIDHAHWIFLGNVIVQTLRQQGDLRPSLTFNKSLHDRPRYDLDDQKIRQLREFHTAWTKSGHAREVTVKYPAITSG